jgi:hypothetical protein
MTVSDDKFLHNLIPELIPATLGGQAIKVSPVRRRRAFGIGASSGWCMASVTLRG